MTVSLLFLAQKKNSGWRQLMRPWKPHALRCSDEGWHIFAFQHLGKKAGTHSGSTRRRPTGGSRRRKSGWRSCLSARKQSVQPGPHLPVGCRGFGQKELFVLATMENVEEALTKVQGGGRAALIFERLANGVAILVQAIFVLKTAIVHTWSARLCLCVALVLS